MDAQNLIDVRRNLQRSCALTPLVVPAVIEALTGSRVLVMEFVEGTSVKEAGALQAAGVDCAQLVQRVSEAWASQMFDDGVFNADAHAGNILARHDALHGAVPILLDFGLCKRLEPPELRALCKMMHALEELDGDVMLEALVELGFQVIASADCMLIASLIASLTARLSSSWASRWSRRRSSRPRSSAI